MSLVLNEHYINYLVPARLEDKVTDLESRLRSNYLALEWK